MQSVPITTNIVSSNLAQVRSTTLCDKVCQWIAIGRWFSLSTPVSSTNKADCHEYSWNIVESDIKHHKPNFDECLFVCLFCLMVYNTTFNNISVVSWWSVLLVEETGGPWQTLSHNVLHLDWSRFELKTSVVIGTNCIDSCKSNYHMITATMALWMLEENTIFCIPVVGPGWLNELGSWIA